MKPSNKEKTTLTIGDYLQQQRIERSISLEEIASKTKINLSMLQILENSDFSKLPQKTYVIGYIKSYCKEIQIKDYSALDILKQNYLANDVQEDSSPVDSFYNQKKTYIKKTHISLSLITLIGLISFYYISFHKTNNQPKTIQKKIIKIKKQSISPKVTNDSLSTSKDNQNNDNNISNKKNLPEIKPSKVKLSIIPKQTKTPQIKEVIKVETKIVKKTKPKTKPKTEQFSKIEVPLYTISSNSDIQMPTQYQKRINNKLENIYIKAIEGDTWLTYKIDNSNVINTLIKKGDILFLQGKNIQTYFGNVNATTIFLNNKVIEPISKSGVTSLIFPLSNQANYTFPLFTFKENGQITPTN